MSEAKQTKEEKKEQTPTKDILLIGYYQQLLTYMKVNDLPESKCVIATWQNCPESVLPSAHRFKFPEVQGWKDKGLIEEGLQNGSRAMIDEKVKKVSKVVIIHNKTHVIEEDLTTKAVREVDVEALLS